jgi:cephalosporin hydroxylase
VKESEELTSEGSLIRGREREDRAARATRRYLELLRGALLDEHYLENELRIEHLLECISAGEAVDVDKLANPARYMTGDLQRWRREREAGQRPNNGGSTTGDVLAYAGFGRARLEHLDACLQLVRDEAVEGDLVDSETGRGGAAIYMRGFLEAHELPGPRVWVADRFAGGSSTLPDTSSRFPPDLDTVREAFARFDLLDDRVVFLQGTPSGALAQASIAEVALLRVGSNDSEELRAVLEALYDRVAPGGFVVVDAYGAADCRATVDSFRSSQGIVDPLQRIDWSGAAWRKARSRGRAKQRRNTTRHAAGATQLTATKDLGVVVVVHNMRREAVRTLHSLSRSYQRGVDDLDYEVIVVENGSEPEQRLGEDFVCGFGPEFRYIDLGDDATPSPGRAVNRGIAASTGRNLVLMIDGAHLLTPGVLRHGMLGLTTYAPAIVAAKQWYVGPGQQPVTVGGGYDERFEDRLFAEIDWPTDGYRLFEVGHFLGDRDWIDGDWESNCIFVPRALLEQLGGMDERFSAPGGGFVNLDFFDRMVRSPGVTLVTMLGEGSFHQIHGGTTTNVTDNDELIRSYRDQYAELRGRRFRIPPQQTHFIGSVPPPARRVRARRMNSFEHFRNAQRKLADKRPSRRAPVPQDLKAEFIDAFWRSGEWHRTTWLGKWTHRAPTDLLAYQELIFSARPKWIVQTRTGAGGLALFLATLCDLIDGGQVLSIDGYPLGNRPDHPRITYLSGDPAADRTGEEAREIVGQGPQALVILGGAGAPKVVDAFRNYAPLVPLGSYVVVEDTILEGKPAWPDFGPGPASAVQEIIQEGEFIQDPSLERFALTFNVGGFLKRVR